MVEVLLQASDLGFPIGARRWLNQVFQWTEIALDLVKIYIFFHLRCRRTLCELFDGGFGFFPFEHVADGGNGALFGSTQGTRNMLSLRDNLNAVDLMQKVISFTIDGLFSRDVQ